MAAILILQPANVDKLARGPVCKCFDDTAQLAQSCGLRGNTGNTIVPQNGPEAAENAEGRPTVFFSYSRADFAKARPIIELLEQSGFCVWWDGKLEAGVKYVESTQDALEHASAVVVAWSATSAASHWVRDEAMSGRERNCLVPLTLDGSQPPLGFRQFQVLDFSGWGGRPASDPARELIRATAALHGREMPPNLPPPPRRFAISRRQGLIGLALGAGVGASGFAGWRLFGGGAGAQANSIAVLPFANDSRDPAQDYLSAGLATELRSMLARNQALKVVARSSSEVVQRRGLDAVAAAQALKVAFIVEGSVQVVGDKVRITSDLIDGATGVGRWSKTFNETIESLLAMQQSMAEAISSELSFEMGSGEAALKLGRASVPAAYEAYLKGWDLFIRSADHASDLEVLGHFQTAARLDAGFAGARAGEAAAYLALGHTAESASAASAAYASAVASARAAVALGPDLGEGHSVLAQTLFEAQLKVREARPVFERALTLGAGSAATLARYGEYEALTGHAEPALRAIEAAIQRDPLNPAIFNSAGLVHYAASDHRQAIAMHRRALALDTAISGAHAGVANSLFAGGDAQAALREWEMEPFAALRLAGMAIAQHILGETAAAKASMAELVATYGDQATYQQAQVLASWGEAEAALEKLALARELGDAGLTFLLIDPMFEPLRGRAEYKAVLQGLGFA